MKKVKEIKHSLKQIECGLAENKDKYAEQKALVLSYEKGQTQTLDYPTNMDDMAQKVALFELNEGSRTEIKPLAKTIYPNPFEQQLGDCAEDISIKSKYKTLVRKKK